LCSPQWGICTVYFVPPPVCVSTPPVIAVTPIALAAEGALGRLMLIGSRCVAGFEQTQQPSG
jgi:hypothetical protein